MKGVALPIEVLVIVVIAVIVLLGIIAVYFAGWTPFAETSGIDAIKNNACRKLSYDCSKSPTDITAGIDLDDDGDIDADDNLQLLCDTYFATGGSEDACKGICGCGGAVTISGGSGPGPSPTCVCDWVPWLPTTTCFIPSLGINGYMSDCECSPLGCGGTCINAVGASVAEGGYACVLP